VWERNITPLGIPRGINGLWTKGGLQYAPPIR
jgi:general L-amino acid transport system substrate-binding protein